MIADAFLGYTWAAVTLTVVAAAVWLSWRLRRSAADAADSGRLRDALEKSERRVRDFSRSQARLVNALADEVQRPVATALGHAELLLASSSEPAVVERYASALVEDVRHLAGLVESYLRLAQPLAQEDISKHVPVQVHDLVMAAASRCRALAVMREVTIVPTLAQTRDGAAVEVLGDAVLLEAMLENLLRNGVLSSPRGARVELRVDVVGEEVRVAVLDRGAPVSDLEVEDLFEGFFDADGASGRPGSRLSLAIAMRVAEHHRGTISLSTAPEGGCRFEVQLPRWSSDGAR